MATPTELLENNQAWSERIRASHPGLLRELEQGQSPDVLWIGCADSRVPANQIVGCEPGELFVHRNVANLIVESDPNGMSVLTYAVEALGISHIIVCGHYRCGGVQVVLSESTSGVLSEWLAPVKELVRERSSDLEGLSAQERWDRCCELNVESQVKQLPQLPVVRRAWEDGQELSIHGWIYQLSDGQIRDLGIRVDG